MKAEMQYRMVVCGTTIGIYAVICTENEQIIGISKHAVMPRNSGRGAEAFKEEVGKYLRATFLPPIVGWEFHYHDYFIINSWEDEIVTDERVQEWINDRIAYQE